MGISRLIQTCVYEVQQDLKDIRVHSKDLHFLFVCLSHSTGEQGGEVGAAGSEHEPVHLEDTATDFKPHVTEVGAEPHLVHLGQDESGVAV